jgi:hypothetical protein
MMRASVLFLLFWACGHDEPFSNDALAGTWLSADSSQSSGRLDLKPGPRGVYGTGELRLPDAGIEPFTVTSDADARLVLTFPDGGVEAGRATILPNCVGQPIPPPWQINAIVAPAVGVVFRDPQIFVVCSGP